LLHEAGDADASAPSAGPSLTNEGAFARSAFLRGAIGTENLDAQFGDGLDPVLLQSLRLASIATGVRPGRSHAEWRPREELPVLFLALTRQASRIAHTLI